MKKVILYDKKENKIVLDNFLEVDLYDFSNYAGAFHIDECKRIPKSLVNNKTILEWFTINKISCWWLICPAINRKFDEGIQFVDRLFSFIELNSPDLIEIRGVYDKLDLIKQVCKIKNIKLKYPLHKSWIFNTRKMMWRFARKVYVRYFLDSRYQKKLDIFTREKFFEPPSTNYAFVCSSETYRRTVVDEMGQNRREEFVTQPFLEILKKKGIEPFCCDTSILRNNSILNERIKSEFNWFPIEVFIKKRKNNTAKQNIRNLRQSVNQLSKLKFGKIFDYRNISLVDYMKPLFEDQFLEHHLPNYLDLFEKFLDFFSKFPPKEVIQLFEYGQIEKVILMAAKRNGIRTLAIQHGIIHDHHVDYMHQEIQSTKEPLGNPIADLTLTYGDFYKKVLTQSGNYPPEKVFVIGNPTFYNIEEIKKNLSRKKILKKFDLPDKKIILLPADYAFTKSITNPERIILDLLEKNFKKENEILLLVRPHPGDFFNQVYLDKLYPSKIFKCSKGSLLEDVYISDLVITNGSTVAIDAAFFKKPIIYFDLPNENQISDIPKHMINIKMAISSSREDLFQKIMSVLSGNEKNLEITKGIDDFLNDFFSTKTQINLEELI